MLKCWGLKVPKRRGAKRARATVAHKLAAPSGTMQCPQSSLGIAVQSTQYHCANSAESKQSKAANRPIATTPNNKAWRHSTAIMMKAGNARRQYRVIESSPTDPPLSSSDRAA